MALETRPEEAIDINFMIQTMKTKGYLTSPTVEEAFRVVDRAEFVPPEQRENAYYDYPMSIGYEQTISQPSMVATLLQSLELVSGQKVLDVGAGSGWTTALIAELIGPKGKVIGVERIPELVEFGTRNLRKFDYPNAKIIQAGTQLGYPEEAPYDRILVSADAKDIPGDLLPQMTRVGRMVVPICGRLCIITQSDKGRAEVQQTNLVTFVPLIEEPSA